MLDYIADIYYNIIVRRKQLTITGQAEKGEYMEDKMAKKEKAD